MSYTEIPTDLLVDAFELLTWITDERHLTDDGNAVVPFDTASIEQFQPLLKWLEYICAVWGAQDEREHERIHRYCTAARSN